MIEPTEIKNLYANMSFGDFEEMIARVKSVKATFETTASQEFFVGQAVKIVGGQVKPI